MMKNLMIIVAVLFSIFFIQVFVMAAPVQDMKKPFDMVDTVTDLRKITGLTEEHMVQVAGYYVSGDGGGGSVRHWDGLSLCADDGGACVDPHPIDENPGRWIWGNAAQSINVLAYGVKADGRAASDKENSTALQAALDFGRNRVELPVTKTGKEIYFKSVIVPYGVAFLGQGAKRTLLISTEEKGDAITQGFQKAYLYNAHSEIGGFSLGATPERKAGSGNGITIDNTDKYKVAYRVRISDIFVRGQPGFGLYLNQPEMMYLGDSVFVANGRGGIYADGGLWIEKGINNLWRNIRAANNGGVQLSINNLKQMTIINFEALVSADSPNFDPLIAINNSDGILLINPDCERVGNPSEEQIPTKQYGIYIAGGENNSILGGVFGNLKKPIYINNSQNPTVDKPEIRLYFKSASSTPLPNSAALTLAGEKTNGGFYNLTEKPILRKNRKRSYEKLIDDVRPLASYQDIFLKDGKLAVGDVGSWLARASHVVEPYNPPRIDGNSSTYERFNVFGVHPGDITACAFNSQGASRVLWSCWISAVDVVTIAGRNMTNTAIDLPLGLMSIETKHYE